MVKKEKQLTSVKVDKEMFHTFRIECLKNKFSLQKLVERGVYLYLNDAEFKRMLTNVKIDL